MMRGRVGAGLLALVVSILPGPAQGQPQAPVPLACDFKKVAPGSWADYTITVGASRMTARWAFLGRDPGGNTVELTLDGPAASATQIGGKVVTRLVLVPDPVGVSKPVKQMVMQLGERPPVEVPLDLPGLPGHKFQNPDPKKLVGRETIRVGAGAFDTSHYRESWEGSIVDAWLSDRVPPLGLVRTTVTATAGTTGPEGKPMPPVTMELAAHGANARPVITRAPVPFPAAK